jgi:NodT family efflux transporter outer membrane factor (OMF) lipoprotein
MLRQLRSGRLASGLPHDVFQQPANNPKFGCSFGSVGKILPNALFMRGWAASGRDFLCERNASTVRTLFLLTLGYLMVGCTVGPNYLKPNVTLAPFHNTASVADRTVDQPAPPLDQWWIGFRDPELTKIIQRALAQNLDIQASLERVLQARAAAKTAGARLLPAMDASTQALAMRQSLESPIGAIAQTLPGYNRNAELYDVGASASWEIDLFGGLRRGEEAAKAEAGAAEAMHLGVRVSVAADAADAYFQIRGLQARIKVIEDLIITDTKLFDLIRLRKTNGMSTDREVAQAEAVLAQAQGSVPLLKIELEAQLNRLDVLMGAQPGTYASELSASTPLPDVPRITAKSSDLLRRRPDIIAAERNIAAANAGIGAALSDYYPKVSLSGLLGFESLTPTHLFKSVTFQPTAIAGLRWRLFDFGKIDGEVALANAATREALVRYRQTVLHAAEDVENACAALVQLETHGRDVTRQIGALTQARDESQEAYRAGLIALTDALDANRQLLVAEDDLPRTQADTARAAVRLFRALGGGW